MNYVTRLVLRHHPGAPLTGADLLTRAGLTDPDTKAPTTSAWTTLNTLVADGLMYKTGAGPSTLYGLTDAGQVVRGALPQAPSRPETSMPQHHHWTQQRSGTALDLLNPRPSMIHWDDIAYGLSRESRWNGQTTHPYTVAQHTVLVCAILREQGHHEHLPAGLLHDATEAYLKDLPTPVKTLIPNYAALERSLRTAIGKRFGVHLDRLSPEVKAADRLALHAEAWTLHAHPPIGDWAGPREDAQLPGPFSRTVIAMRGDDAFWRAQLGALLQEVGL